MARRMVGDDQDVFRVVVRRQVMVENPDWERGIYDPENNPRMIPSDTVLTRAYGPYNSIGAARGQATGHREYCGEARPGVVDVKIQKAQTTWEDVA
jgi:hypothetical protein